MSEIHRIVARRVVDALDREIRSRGRGAIRDLERATCNAKSWWHHRAASGDLTLSQALQILDHLGLDPVKFLGEVLDGEVVPRLDRPKGDPPAVVAKAWERARSAETGGEIDASIVDALDAQIFEDPAEVVRVGSWAVEKLELRQVPRVLGVVGSAWRLMNRLRDAEHAIHAGIRIAERLDGTLPGNLLVRLASVLADRGEAPHALALAERASLIHVQNGERDGYGRALVAQGVFLAYLDRPEKAIEVIGRARSELAAESTRHRFGALQVSAAAHHRLGNHREALSRIAEARALQPENDDWAEGKILWLEAKIQAALGDIDAATDHLEVVCEIFRALHPGECCLATCDLLRLYLSQGETQAAYERAITMRSLVEPLSENPIIAAALADVLRSGKAGLSLALLERVSAQIEGERQKVQRWRSLRTAYPPGS